MENAYRQWYYEVGGQRVGPVSWETMIDLVKRGVITAHAKVFSDGWGAWVPAAQVAGLGVAALPESHDAAMRMVLPVGRSPMAIASGYLGLLSPMGIFAPFALLTGVLALRTLKRQTELHGAGRAWFGIVMGALFSMLYGYAMLK
jgi:hypothetical protein